MSHDYMRVALLLLATVIACAPAARDPAPSPEGASVRVMLQPARDVVVEHEGDTLVLRDVRELVGRAWMFRNDSISLVLSGARSAGERLQSVRGEVTLAPAAGREVTVLSEEPGALNAIGVLALPAVVLFILVYGFGLFRS